MKYLNFDSKGRAYVTESEFADYMAAHKQPGDYTRDKDRVVEYYAAGGYKIGEYHRVGRYGMTF